MLEIEGEVGPTRISGWVVSADTFHPCGSGFPNLEEQVLSEGGGGLISFLLLKKHIDRYMPCYIRTSLVIVLINFTNYDQFRFMSYKEEIILRRLKDLTVMD